MDKDKQIEILEKRVKWLERKVGQLEYENHVQDEEYMSLGGTLNNERMEHAKLQKEYAKLKKGICQDGGRKRKAEQADVVPTRGYVMGVKNKE